MHASIPEANAYGRGGRRSWRAPRLEGGESGRGSGSLGSFLLWNMDLHLDIRNVGGYLRFRLLTFGLESVPRIRHLLLDEDYSVAHMVHYGLKSSNFLFALCVESRSHISFKRSIRASRSATLVRSRIRRGANRLR